MLKEHKAFIAKESKSDVLILILMEHAQRVNREFKGIDAYEKS